MESLLPIQHSYLIPLLPLAGAIVAGLVCTGERKKHAHWPIWIGVGASALLSIWILVGMMRAHPGEGTHTISATRNFFTWIKAGDFTATAGFFFDPLTAIMLCVVCGIGFLITIFSAGYMKGEAGYFRFFAYLGLFIFAMTCLVMGENLLVLYLGWEGVGLCSYLLIGYYYDRPAAREAAKKAFIVNRVGDFGFALGIMLCYSAFGTISYFGDGVGTNTGLLERAINPQNLFQWQALQWIPFLLMLGAFGKSAQFPLHVWLPDAMEGPTPVSALIHAATMVTAGVYMIARCGTLFVGNAGAMITIASIGAFTALFAATIALRQFDLKKVFAYSTISQLGFMFVGVATLAPVAGVFHLVTHAFFKALLFLGSGVVMHAMAGELDMRRMSGLKTVLPKTRYVMLIGCAALAGFPLLSGFFSKDEILISAWDKSVVLGLVMLFTAFLTAYYTFRLYFRVFHGPLVVPNAHKAHDEPDEHADHEHHDHEPSLMMVPLMILAIGALFVGYINFPKHAFGHFLGESPSVYYSFKIASGRYGGAHVAPMPFGQPEVADKDVQEREHARHNAFMFISAIVALTGIYLAYLMHLKYRSSAEAAARRFSPVTHLLEAKYWVDEIYDRAIIHPLRALGRALFTFDRFVIDGLVWMIGFIPQVSGFALKLTVQRGYLQGYALAMLLGIAVILLIVFM